MLSFHVKFVQTDRRTNGRTDGQTDNGKTICPRSFDTGAQKKTVFTKGQSKLSMQSDLYIPSPEKRIKFGSKHSKGYIYTHNKKLYV